MSLEEFLLDTQGVIDWMLKVGTDAFSIVKSNWILLLSFCVGLTSVAVDILLRIKNIKK